jgi:CheY-like chemotaxis protein
MARIMIIDDDASVREALAALVGAAGHETCMASDGRRGLDRLPAFQPDLVITDILMPGMEGMETIRELRKRHPLLPIIAVSGCMPFNGTDYLRTAQRLGASQSLPKPVEPGALIEAIRALLAPAARALPVN